MPQFICTTALTVYAITNLNVKPTRVAVYITNEDDTAVVRVDTDSEGVKTSLPLYPKDTAVFLMAEGDETDQQWYAYSDTNGAVLSWNERIMSRERAELTIGIFKGLRVALP